MSRNIFWDEPWKSAFQNLKSFECQCKYCGKTKDHYIATKTNVSNNWNSSVEKKLLDVHMLSSHIMAFFRAILIWDFGLQKQIYWNKNCKMYHLKSVFSLFSQQEHYRVFQFEIFFLFAYQDKSLGDNCLLEKCFCRIAKLVCWMNVFRD